MANLVNISAMTATFSDGAVNTIAIGMDVTNTASGSGARLLDLKVGGVSKVSVSVDGTIRDPGGSVRNIPINVKSNAYTLTLGDSGEAISITTGNVAVPNNVFSGGDAVTIFNNSDSSQNITNNGDVMMYLAGTATVGTRALAQRGLATILCVEANTFVISGAGLT